MSANIGFVADNRAFVKAVSGQDLWIVFKKEEESWYVVDTVGLSALIDQHGPDYFQQWAEAIQACPSNSYPEGFLKPDGLKTLAAGPSLS